MTTCKSLNKLIIGYNIVEYLHHKKQSYSGNKYKSHTEAKQPILAICLYLDAGVLLR